MNPIISNDIREVIEAVHYRPSVSIIMPFDIRVNQTKELGYSLKIATDKVEQELTSNYPPELASLVINKLKSIVGGLSKQISGKSVAIFVSPVFEKVFFLDFLAEEKIVIDESFEIRDLVFGKKQVNHFLVMLLSAHECKLFLAGNDRFTRLVNDAPETVDAYVNEVPERVANFSDVQDRRDTVTEKFLRHMDQSLSHMLKTYSLPVMIVGADRIIGHFRQLTRNEKSIVSYITGNYENASIPELKDLIQPSVLRWQQERQHQLLKEMDEATGRHKLVSGIMDVWREARNHNGRLLVVERNFMYPAERGADEGTIYEIEPPYNRFSYIKDAVDDVIEVVLKNGGDVEFVEEGLLKEYGHIALLQYY